MSVEIRPVTEAEATAYLRVLPQENGLPMWEPAPAAWYAGPGPWPPPQLPAPVETLLTEGFHPQAAIVDGTIVGASATLSRELTVPGGRQIRFGGVTSTGVLPTHRRRGLLRAMMLAMFESCLTRGEVVAALSASEGSIYGRYGFAPATFHVRWEMERSEAGFGRGCPPASLAGVEIVTAEVVRQAWPALHDRVRRDRVGEVSASPDRWAGLTDTASGTDGPPRYVVHRGPDGEVDGTARYRTPWSADLGRIGTLRVDALEAATPAAYEALWRLLVDIDLTKRVVAARRPVDEPLRWMLANPRAMRVTRSADNLWVRLLDVGAALEARSYDSAGSLVLAVDDAVLPANTGHWCLDASPAGATCRKVTAAAPDVTLDVQALGSLYLGGVAPAVLAGAGRITEMRPGALAVLGRLFRQDPAPFNAVGF